MHYKMTLILVIVLSFVLVLPAYAEQELLPDMEVAQEETQEGDSVELETTAEAALLMDYASGKVLFSKNPEQELPMASVTKLMTLLLAVEAVEEGKLSLSETIVASEHAAGMGGSQIYLEPGEEMTAEDMLISIATGSANDASVAVAEKIAGTEDAFVKMMNQKVEELGLNHTNFANPTGLPADNHYSSAYDMAVILRECLNYPLFKRISSIYEYDLRGGEFKLWNTNKLLKWYDGVDAGKTGWTSESDYCLASSAERDGMRLITVVLGTSETRSHFRESINLYNYGFSQYEMVNLVDPGTPVETVRVNKGTAESLRLLTEGQAGLAVKRGEKEGYYGEIETPGEITAPVEKGETLGIYKVLKDGEEIFSVPLIAENTVPEASILRQMYKVLDKMYNMNEDNLKTG